MSRWKKSSFCDSGACVEIKFDEGDVLLRSSDDPYDTTVRFTQAEWSAFLDGVHNMEFEG